MVGLRRSHGGFEQHPAVDGRPAPVEGLHLVRDGDVGVQIRVAGGRATFVQMDTVNQADWDNAGRMTKETYGALHILMNIVGSNQPVLLPNINIEQWNKVLRDQA